MRRTYGMPLALGEVAEYVRPSGWLYATRLAWEAAIIIAVLGGLIWLIAR